ncbi:MAG: putative ABC exporter domain-containing protein [Gemmatimonadota bacterium]
MIRHFLYFIGIDFRNKIKRRVARLRSPRYAIALLFGLAYFFFAFGGPALFGTGPPRAEREWPAGLVAAAPFYLALLVIWWWLGPGSRLALNFTPADVNLLFTAPLTRRQLIQFKLLRAQAPILFTSLLVTLFAQRAAGPWWVHLPSAWVLFTTMNLHQVGAELVHTSAKQHGLAGWRRLRVPLLVFVAWVAALGWSIWQVMPPLRADVGKVFVILGEAFTQPPASIALAPLRIVLQPMLAVETVEWLSAFALALLVLVAHYIWVMRTGVAFEESAAEAATRTAAIVEAVRSGKRVSLYDRTRPKKLKPPWFPLGSTGEPAVAVLWKNVLYYTRNFSLFIPIAVTCFAALFGVIVFTEEGSSLALLVAGLVYLGFAGLIAVLGPLGFRNDLRNDLRNIQLLRTLPIGGARMVAAQLAGSTSAMTAAQVALLIPGVILVLLSGRMPQASLVIAGALAAVLALPAFNAIALGIQNGIALWIPAWSRIGSDQPGGVEFMGAQMMNLFGSILMFTIALIPPLILGSIVFAGAALKWGNYGVVPGALLFIAALYGEVLLMVNILGNVYDRLDPVESGLLK